MEFRGTIHERLEKDVDGVVIAEAALIRLKLTHLNRVFLLGETSPMQGKLAVVCRVNENVIDPGRRASREVFPVHTQL